MITKWAEAIVKIYKNVIVPKWKKKVTPVRANPKLASQVVDSNLLTKEVG